jgi:hypothetical protein
MKVKVSLFACSLVLIVGTHVWGQVSTSNISGVVTDLSGAFVAGAQITAKNEATGVTERTTSTPEGTYTFSSLIPGQYTITVSKAGFRNFSSLSNVLTVGVPLVVDVHLQVGATSEIVEVQSSYVRIETTSAQISDIMPEKDVKNLPLNGRNPLTLLTLEPGVVQRTNNSAGSDTHVFGSRDRAHNLTIDGIDANESTVPNPQSNIQRLTPDNVQEFRTVTLGATAELGRNSGANVMVATRPGSNAIHGDAYWFHRNTALNANEWFNNYAGLARPTLRLHQFGGDVGGPIIKNKTFFFFSYQRSQIFQTEPISATNVGILGAPALYTPTLLNNGIFRFVRGTVNFNGKAYNQNSPGLVDAAGNLRSGVPVCGGSVTGNCVDSYNILDPKNFPAGITGPDPTIMAALKSLPVPNGYNVGDGFNRAVFNWNPPSKFLGPGYLIRIDQNFGPSDTLFGRYLQSYYNTEQGDFLNSRPQVYPGFPPLGEVGRNGRNLAVSWRHTFNPNLVNEFTFGFNRFRFNFTFGESNPNFSDLTKNPPWFDDCIFGSMGTSTAFPAPTSDGIDAPLCASPHTQRAITTPQFIDNVSWLHGRHNIRAGVNFRFYVHNDSRGFFGTQIMAPGIVFRRSIRPSGFLNIPSGSGASSPNSTDMNALQESIVTMFGMPAAIAQGFVADFAANKYTASRYATVYTRAHQYDVYLQDELHLRKDLTLNAGVRWEYNPPPFDAKDTLAPDKPIDGSQGLVTFVRSGGWFKNSNLGAVGPRIGLAYAPNAKTSIRAGYSWLFDTISTFQVTAIAGKVPGFALECVTSLKTGGALSSESAGCVAPGGINHTISTGFPTTVPSPTVTPSAALLQPAQVNGAAPNIGAFDPNLKNPSVHEWSLTIQRELPWRVVGEVGYVGKRGTHLYRAYDLNQININPAFLSSFNVARQNSFSGCKPDGTGCPAGVTGQSPTLLIQMLGGASAASAFLTSSSSSNDFRFGDVGSFATRVDQQVDIKVNGFPATYFRPNPQFTQIFFQDSGGDSYYHGLFVAMRRKFEGGLDFGLSYTYSKSIDDMSVDPTGASTSGGLSTTNSRTPTDVHNFRLDRALSDFNNTHILLANMLYELPFGRNKRFASGVPGWLNQILGGWSFSGIFDYQSGEPYTLTSGARTSNGGHVSSVEVRGPLNQGELQFVSGVEGPVMYRVSQSLVNNPADPHFNCKNVLNTPTYFCIPQPGQNGRGRNFVLGPSFWNLDSGLSKNFKMTERVNLQFRAEFFNILNHVNFENPRNATSGSPSVQSNFFGQTCCVASSLPSSATVIAIGEPNRVIQFGLKLSF